MSYSPGSQKRGGGYSKRSARGAGRTNRQKWSTAFRKTSGAKRRRAR